MTAGLIYCAASGLDVTGLFCLIPALLLGCSLLARRYPGERLLLRCTQARKSRRRRAAPLGLSAQRRRMLRVPRGGSLLGFALAVRPPPALSAAS